MIAIFTSRFSWCHGSSSEFSLVGVSGVSHLGSHFNITGFYMDLGYYGNVGNGTGGGGMDCCVYIPKNWRPGLSVDVRWTVSEWVKMTADPTSGENGKTIGIYRARVNVERYSSAGTLYVHFFPGGKVRVVSSEFGALSSMHPVVEGDPDAQKKATSGRRASTSLDDFEKKLIEKARKNSQ
ncbi:DUF3304 domain-containing protein [Duganella sp. BJB488]|nr:DUF3304 domain-containing protein [Duganella sp. BJB488]